MMGEDSTCDKQDGRAMPGDASYHSADGLSLMTYATVGERKDTSSRTMSSTVAGQTENKNTLLPTHDSAGKGISGEWRGKDDGDGRRSASQWRRGGGPTKDYVISLRQHR